MVTKRMRRVCVGVTALALVALAGCAGTPSPGPGGPTSPPASSTVPPTSQPTSPPTSPTTPSTSTPSTSTPSTTQPSPTTTQAPTYLTGMPVYFVGESGGAFKLFREFRTVKKLGGPISSTVSAMTRLEPLDPDYLNPWSPASWTWVTQRGSTVTVDLSADALRNTNIGSELAELAVQQLVYTATAAAHVAGTDATTVVITINGKAADAWGTVRLGTPMTRAPMTDVQAQAWIVTPQEGATLRAGTVDFTGYGTSFEATFTWQVTSLDGAVMARGSAMGGSMGTFGTVKFSAKLAPGKYVVRLATDDPSGGAEGHGPAVDTKRFAVK